MYKTIVYVHTEEDFLISRMLLSENSRAWEGTQSARKKNPDPVDPGSLCRILPCVQYRKGRDCAHLTNPTESLARRRSVQKVTQAAWLRNRETMGVANEEVNHMMLSKNS